MTPLRWKTWCHSFQLTLIHSLSHTPLDSRKHQMTWWILLPQWLGLNSQKISEKMSLKKQPDQEQSSGLILQSHRVDQMQWENRCHQDSTNTFHFTWEFTKSKIWTADSTIIHAQYTPFDRLLKDEPLCNERWLNIRTSSVHCGKIPGHMVKLRLQFRQMWTIMKSTFIHHILFFRVTLCQQRFENSRLTR